MKKKQILLIFISTMMLLSQFLFTQAQPKWRVNDFGQLSVNGTLFEVHGGIWTGLEGQYELHNDTVNPSGAPMELLIGNVFWSPSGRTYDQNINEFKALGFNVIKLPISPQTLDPLDTQGRQPFLKNHDSVVIENARLALETVIKKLDEAGLYVLLEIHSCSNYVGWRAGRLDARPPYVDKYRDNYNFLREDCSCSATNNPRGVTRIQAYDEEKWLADLQTLASLPEQLGVTNIMGIDIFNEPWDYTWDQWRKLIDKAYYAIDQVNPNILIFAGGISAEAGAQDGTEDSTVGVPHGDPSSIPGKGENFYEAGDNRPSMPKDRLVYSPHCFGPSHFVSSLFMDPEQPECEGLEGDEAGDCRCDIIINIEALVQAWDEHFGYLKELGYAVVIGAFGGNINWPDKAPLRDQDRYAYLKDHTVDLQWQKTFINYLLSREIYDSFYWAINPEDLNTGGIYDHAYDPVSNTGGWGTWLAPNPAKRDLLTQLWNHGGIFPTFTPMPTLIPDFFMLGDVNGDRVVNIVDALLIAQYYVGLPVDIRASAADVSCRGDRRVSIVDALVVAQYYVGIIDKFCD